MRIKWKTNRGMGEREAIFSFALCKYEELSKDEKQGKVLFKAI